MTEWQEAELHFWREWLPHNLPTYANSYRRYKDFLPWIGPEFEAVLDVGCGPFPYSGAFPFKRRYLIDPLIEQYRKIPGNSIQDTDKCYTGVQFALIVYEKNLVAFVLNCLDHMPPDDRSQVVAA